MSANRSAAPWVPRSNLAEDLAVVLVLWRRDIVRFFRERSRIVGALVQPLIFWLILGSGMAASFRLPGATNVGYLQYFFPGVLAMVSLFTSIFATMSVIEDRSRGFLQAVLVCPSSRAAVVVGKCLGSSTVALLQAGLFLLLTPLAGYPWAQIDWALVALALALMSLGLGACGFAVAWWLDSTQGYHVVMSLVLIPLWVLSGALFPASGAPWIGVIMRLNPMAYGVSALRRGLEGGALGPSFFGSSRFTELACMSAFAIFAVGAAAIVCSRKR